MLRNEYFKKIVYYEFALDGISAGVSAFNHFIVEILFT